MKKLLVALACVACLVAGSAGPARTARICVPQWRTIARPVVPTINSVAAISPTDVWIVGSTEKYATYTTPTLPVLMHWDGHRFRRYRSFAPTEQHGQLTGVAGIASTDVWAVGIDDRRNPGITRLVVLHWNGVHWRRVPVQSFAAAHSLPP